MTVSTTTYTVMTCDRCGFKETCDDEHRQDNHWGKVRAQTIGGSAIASGYELHLCVTCMQGLQRWWGSGKP